MKKIIYLLIVLPLFIASCSDDKIDVKGESNIVSFYGVLNNSEVKTRAADTTWDANDGIGVFMLQNNANFDIIDIYHNKPYSTAAGDGLFTPKTVTDQIILPSGSTVKFVAYHPYTSDLTADWKYKLDIKSQSNLSGIDLLYSDNATNISQNKPTLNFQHQLSKLVFNVEILNVSGLIANHATQVTNLPFAGTFDLVAKTITTDQECSNILLQSVKKSGVTNDAQYLSQGIVIPTSEDARDFVFSFTMDGKNYSFDYDISTLKLEMGKKYIYNVKIDSQKGIINNLSATIEDWNTITEDINININTNSRDFRLGITKISPDSLAFKLFAPRKQEIYLIGDFNNWTKDEKYKMEKDSQTNTFFLKIGDLDPSKEYVCQYAIDDTYYMGDPYASKTSDPLDKYIPTASYPNMIAYPTEILNSTIGMVVSTKNNKYNWTIDNFKISNASNLVIYELLIRDFMGADDVEGNIKEAKSKIPYLKELGITAIELMPFNEFDGNDSWGYNPTYYFAPDKVYGTDTDYKDFIDECHKNGIAVIMDMVLNHCWGQCPLAYMYLDSNWKLTESTEYFNKESPNTDYSWGYDFNHENKETQQFVDSVCSYWMSEYKVDGFRFDFTKGFTQNGGPGWAYDSDRINILKRINNEIKKRNNNAIMILEHLTDNSEEYELAAAGMYLWGEMSKPFAEATMGWGEQTSGQGNWSSANWADQNRGWSKPNLIAYMESHDEERMMYKNNSWGYTGTSYDVKNLSTGLQRSAAATAIYMTIPGPKMIWQFGEVGYDFSIDYNDRTGKKPKAWNNGYFEDPDRLKLKDVYATMAKLKTSNPKMFASTDQSTFMVDTYNNLKQVRVNDGQNYVYTIANMDVTPITNSFYFAKQGNWTEIFTNEAVDISNQNVNITLQPGEYRVYISN